MSVKRDYAKTVKDNGKRHGSFMSATKQPFFQPKLTIGPTDDVYEREADAVAEKVMRMPSTKEPPFFSPKPIPIKPFVQTKCAACDEEEKLQLKKEDNDANEKVTALSFGERISNEMHIQRQESPPDNAGSVAPSTRDVSPPSLGVNWFEMSRPFLTRGAQNLLYDPSAFKSISQQWGFNYNFFNTLGLGPDLSKDASNFFTPFAVDSALKRDFPLPWEIWDRELNTSTIMISPTLFNFDIHNLKKSFTMPSPFRGIFGLPENPYNVQRKCKRCEDEESIHRKESNKSSSQKTDSMKQTLQSAGQPMDNSTKKLMEQRFGHDFNEVRIHNDVEAHQSSADINAFAYTHQNHIVFGANQYQPNTNSGQRLLAHELTHVVQQNHAFPFSHYVQRESIYEDVASVNANRAGGIVSGTVDRYEYNDRAAYNARVANNRTNVIHHGTANVRFDSNRCVLEVPVSVQVVNQAAGITTTCGDITGQRADPLTPVSSSTFTSAIPRILNTLNDSLNGWFNIRLGNPSIAGCRASTVPIRVIITQVTANPDYTIIITGNSGRSYVSGNQMVMCGSDVTDESIITHEGGHFVLGHGDEYREKSRPRPRSRERPGQYSVMAQDAPPRLREFLERHFNFASEFMNTAFPGCKASLVRGPRDAAVEVNFNLQAGLMVTPSESFLTYSLGAQFGIPLTSMRRVSLLLGPQLKFMTNMEDVKSFMLGLRAGLGYKTGIGNALGQSWGFSAGVHGELGGLVNFGSGGSESLFPDKDVNPYVEGGANFGISLNSRMFIGAEGAVGKISTPSSGSEIKYYRLGLSFGVSI